MLPEGPVAYLFDFWVFAVGAVVGSFSNVCIYRLPRGESVVFPGSRCPRCGNPIAPYDNIPILSWLVLLGRCRKCRAPISPRYPMVEALVAVLFLLAALRYGATASTALAALLSAAAVILVFTDWECRTLPEEVTLGVLVLALGIAGVRDYLGEGAFQLRFSFLGEAVVGALFGAALLMAVRVGYQLIRGEEGMGFGDVEMIAMIGAIVGPLGVLVTLFFASFGGTISFGVLQAGRRLLWSGFRRQGPEAAALRHGLLLDGDGKVLAAGPRWAEVPGSAKAGEDAVSSRGAARPLAAFVRLSRRRARMGQPTDYGRLFVDDGEDFFRVLAGRAEPLPDGRLLVFLSRTDIPFGIFLAFGSLAALYWGRPVLERLIGWVPVTGSRLLP